DLFDAPLLLVRSSFSLGFEPLIFILLPVAVLFPDPAILLVAQTVWLAGGAIPVYLHAGRTPRRKSLGLLFSLAYLVCAALHGVNIYGLRPYRLSARPLLCMLYGISRGWRWGVWPLLFLVLGAGEDMAFRCCVIGGVCARSPRSRRLGLGIAAASIVWY